MSSVRGDNRHRVRSGALASSVQALFYEVVEPYLQRLGRLTAYLATRPDDGEHPGALTRPDITGFLSWLKRTIAADRERHLVVTATRRFVHYARRLAATGAHPIGLDFQFYGQDIPRSRAATAMNPASPTGGRARPAAGSRGIGIARRRLPRIPGGV